MLAAHVDVPLGQFSASQIATWESAPLNSAWSTKTPGPQEDGSHAANTLTFVLDFKDADDANSTDIFGNVVDEFDVTDFGFAANQFAAVTNAILEEVEQDFFDELLGTAPIPNFQDLAIDFVIGEVGQAPVGTNDFYYIQIGEGIAGPHSNGSLGVAGLGVVRDDAGVGPNFGIQVGDVVASVFTDTIQTIPNLTPANALTSGNLGFTTQAVSGTLSHELGHTISLEHVFAANSTQPTAGAAPLLGTGALDLPNQDRLTDREFSLTANDEDGNQVQHVQQLVNSVGLHQINGPEILTPATTADSTPEFIWEAHEDVLRYDLWVNNVTTGTSQVIRQTNLTTNSFESTTGFTSSHTYRAWVRAYYNSGYVSLWSAAQDVYVDNRPTITSGTSTSDRTPLIEWQPDGNADATVERYDLWVNNLSTGQSQVIRETNLTGTSFAPSANLEVNNTYRIWVKAYYTNGGTSSWSVHRDLTITQPAMPTVNNSGPTPLISWQDDDNVLRYDLWVNNLTTGQSQVIRQTNLTTNSYQVTSSLTSGHEYRAWVKVFYDNGGESIWSVPLTFTIA